MRSFTSRSTGVETTDLVRTNTFSRPMTTTKYGNISLKDTGTELRMKPLVKKNGRTQAELRTHTPEPKAGNTTHCSWPNLFFLLPLGVVGHVGQRGSVTKMGSERHCKVKVRALSYHHQGADCLEATTQHSMQCTQELHTNKSPQDHWYPLPRNAYCCGFAFQNIFEQKRTTAQGHHCGFFFSL